ncbi:hypothetical protein B0H50_10689 [Hallerella porci]|uniref:Uncharacterized protein n=2 Tax=Hallerella porci TaxID=1945871 RepID=A0ABX5LLW5_9BACT|nr:hypothetical protein B0H50_10689 [Hallerella porci]
MRIFVVALFCGLFSFGFSEESKSLWDSFTGFFSSKAKPAGEGPLYQQLADIDNEIQDVQWRYSRERRAVRKSHYKMQLKDLHTSRDSLAALIQKQESEKSSISSATQAKSSAVLSSSSAAISSKALSSSSLAISSSAISSSAISSSSAESSSSVEVPIAPPASIPTPDSVVVTVTVTKYIRDTVIVRDTIFVHDTVFVEKK